MKDEMSQSTWIVERRDKMRDESIKMNIKEERWDEMRWEMSQSRWTDEKRGKMRWDESIKMNRREEGWD